jgi:hypothetical protein
VVALGLLLLPAVWWWLVRERGAVADAPTAQAARPASALRPSPPTALHIEITDSDVDAPSAGTLAEPSDLVPELPDGPPAERRAISGRIVDPDGEPLAGHIVRLTEPPELNPVVFSHKSTPPPEDTTDEDGQFTITGVNSGAKVLQLFGPSPGDLCELRIDRDEPSGVRLGFHAEEGRITLAVPSAGLAGLEFVGLRHPAFWVHGQIEFEGGVGRNPLNSYDGHEIQLRADAPEWNGAPDAEDNGLDPQHASRSRSPGIRLQPMAQTWDRQHRSFLVGADRPTDTVLVIAIPGYATQTRKVQGELPVEQVGTIVLRRVAGLAVRVQNDFADQDVDGSIELRETGGGVPDRVSRHGLWSFQYGDRSQLVWSERSSGRYELRITATGCETWTGSGDLVLTDPESGPPVVDVTLTPAR